MLILVGTWIVVMLAADSVPSADEPLVDVVVRIPDAIVDLKYATDDNFMRQRVYPPNARCLLIDPSARRLVKAADLLRRQGFRLRLYDCYRPKHVQYALWKVFPKPGYVADPKKGSNHSRGGAVDVSLVTLTGDDVEMPTPYDSFTPSAHHASTAASPTALRHRDILRKAMEDAGFRRNPKEWWHFDLQNAAQYRLRDDPF